MKEENQVSKTIHKPHAAVATSEEDKDTVWHGSKAMKEENEVSKPIHKPPVAVATSEKDKAVDRSFRRKPKNAGIMDVNRIKSNQRHSSKVDKSLALTLFWKGLNVFFLGGGVVCQT